jgi:tryptophan synthase alpha chain
VRLREALARNRRDGRRSLVPYVMVDRSRLRGLRATVRAFRDAGATALELGFPFSDPVADGPVLQATADRALQDGTRWSDLLHASRIASDLLPTAVMTYANPVWHRGVARAMSELVASGASGLIVPDLSLEESGPWRREAVRAGISLVLLAAPGIPPDRLDRIARTSRGFLYLVGRYGTTGSAARGSEVDLAPMIARARSAAPKIPVLVGFGIRDPASVRKALRQGADGVIVATALEERVTAGATATELGGFLRHLAAAAATAS